MYVDAQLRDRGYPTLVDGQDVGQPTLVGE